MVAVLASSLQSCNHASRHIYTSRSFGVVAKQHKTIAILPFDVRLGLRPKEMERLTPKQHAELEQSHGRAMQSSLHVHFLNKINSEEEVVTVQDVRVTNALLEEKGITPEEIIQHTPTELAHLLGVDAVITGTMVTEKPLSNGAAMAMMMYTFFFTSGISNGGPTNAGNATLKIFDGATGSLLWSYDKRLSRGLGSNTDTIVRAITRKATRKIPYAKMKA
ncbi:hypothetical protein [Rufibacter roseus]|uniref:DUF3313 domain-containing protein n=2 Tax=Rufibacter roseus TaxID=1567108 RepID=A0ABW2DIE8_9BACT|nr:hypothetical protein [Rufibacter roseus]